MAIRFLIFDLDGTLVDSAPDIVDTTNFLMRARGRSPLPEATIVAAIGEGLKKLVHDLFPETHGNPEEQARLEADFFQAYEDHLLKKTTVYPGVQEFLKKWPGKIAVVTNKYEKMAVQTLEGLGLMTHPWVCVFGAETFPNDKNPATDFSSSVVFTSSSQSDSERAQRPSASARAKSRDSTKMMKLKLDQKTDVITLYTT